MAVGDAYIHFFIQLSVKITVKCTHSEKSFSVQPPPLRRWLLSLKTDKTQMHLVQWRFMAVNAIVKPLDPSMNVAVNIMSVVSQKYRLLAPGAFPGTLRWSVVRLLSSHYLLIHVSTLLHIRKYMPEKPGWSVVDVSSYIIWSCFKIFF